MESNAELAAYAALAVLGAENARWWLARLFGPAPVPRAVIPALSAGAALAAAAVVLFVVTWLRRSDGLSPEESFALRIALAISVALAMLSQFWWRYRS